MKHMVCGFMFDPELEHVALIRKQKPPWQAGLLNGIGGKREDGETYSDAMHREFIEEAGLDTQDWHFIIELKGEDWVVWFFGATCDLSQVRSMEAEQIEVVPLTEINPLRFDMIDNLPWLIPYTRWILRQLQEPPHDH
jgi:8-oxo-dGTP pyrophosphatase MutT (NUDIX family)